MLLLILSQLLQLSRESIRVLQWVQFPLYVALAVRLWSTGLVKKYRAFTLYVVFSAVVTVVGSLLPPRSSVYAIFYFMTEPVLWIFAFFTLLEIYDLVLKNHPGIATLGRRGLIAALVVSLLASAASLAFSSVGPSSPAWILEIFLVVSRFVNASLLLFVFLIFSFLLWFPVPLNRNAVLHCSVFSFYFLAKSAVLLFRTLFGGGLNPYVNFIYLLFACCCLGVWTVYLQNTGEEQVVRAGHAWQKADEQKLLSQLDSLNQTLIQSARK